MMLKSIQRRPWVGRQWGVGSFWNAANILFHMWVVARTMGSLYENTLSHVSMIHILFNVLVILQKLMLKECYLSIYITFSFFLKLHVSLYKKNVCSPDKPNKGGIHPFLWICTFMRTTLLKYFEFLLPWIVRFKLFSC